MTDNPGGRRAPAPVKPIGIQDPGMGTGPGFGLTIPGARLRNLEQFRFGWGKTTDRLNTPNKLQAGIRIE
jgi:hypothetical protein